MNTIQLIGRLTQDPELRSTNTGMTTTKLRLAVPRRKRNREEQPPVYVDVVTMCGARRIPPTRRSGTGPSAEECVAV